MTSEERTRYIETIKAFPKLLEAAVIHLSGEQLDTPYGEGKWTIRQVVHHVADAHINGFARLKMMLTEDNPTLKTYDQEKWAELSDTIDLPIAPSLAIVAGVHYRWGKLLESMTDTDFQRTGYHPEEGDVDLNWHLEAYAGHCDKHFAHITRLLKQKDW